MFHIIKTSTRSIFTSSVLVHKICCTNFFIFRGSTLGSSRKQYDSELLYKALADNVKLLYHSRLVDSSNGQYTFHVIRKQSVKFESNCD